MHTTPCMVNNTPGGHNLLLDIVHPIHHQGMKHEAWEWKHCLHSPLSQSKTFTATIISPIYMVAMSNQTPTQRGYTVSLLHCGHQHSNPHLAFPVKPVLPVGRGWLHSDLYGTSGVPTVQPASIPIHACDASRGSRTTPVTALYPNPRFRSCLHLK